MTRAEASRINGAKSKGPKTEEGKKRSSRNALKHGLASPFILIPQECPDDFRRLCDEYTRHFQPQNEVERDLVYEAVSCMWRILRIQAAESSLIEIEISRQRHEVDQKFNNPDDWVRLAMAFENLANNGRTLALMSRYESRMMRAKDRAREQLRKLRADPQPDDPEDDDPEPEQLANAGENLPGEAEPTAEPGIEKAPNKPGTAPDCTEEPVWNQSETLTDTAPESAPNEPEPQPDQPEDGDPEPEQLASAGENLPGEAGPTAEPGIQKVPNEPATAAEEIAEPAQNQPEALTDSAPESAPNEPEQPCSCVRPNPLAELGIENSRVGSSVSPEPPGNPRSMTNFGLPAQDRPKKPAPSDGFPRGQLQ